ncbi:helix-turn-helix domain-containing protein [Variovorax sp. HJSM1_2]|uniref:helix-turn-helix domain-containing protein n=1 Tax=Variovorax sp. HJSM1_2 TaxID=3366263 RepID=UPI003BBD1FA9
MHKRPTPTCSQCRLREQCLPVDLSCAQLERVDGLVSQRIRVRRGQTLIHPGSTFRSLFAIRSGFFKSVHGMANGREQVVGFQMAGDTLGLDGMGSGQHSSSVVALEDAEVCAMSFAQMEGLAREIGPMQKHIHQLLGREMAHERNVMLLLGSMSAEERVAAFLLDLLQRLHQRGLSASELVLRMSRADIGSYLGLKLETVSRTFSKLAADGLLEVDKRHVRVVNAEALQRTGRGLAAA